MSKHRRDPETALDPLLHAYLDDELTADEIAQFDGVLRPGNTLDYRLKTLRRINDWFQVTRPRSPDSLADSVQRILDAEGSHRPNSVPGTATPAAAGVASAAASAFGNWLGALAARFQDRWAWAPVAVAAALLVALPMLRSTPQPVWVDTVTAPGSGAETVRHEFVIRAGNAKEVCLAGDFNQWSVCELSLHPLR